MGAGEAHCIRVVPASHVDFERIGELFDTGAEPRRCQCQWMRYSASEFRTIPPDVRRELFRDQHACGTAGEPEPGLIALAGDDAVAWIGLGPRAHFVRLKSMKVPWLGRAEDQQDPSVWAITCFLVRTPWRGLGLATTLVTAARDYSVSQGASAVEGYPMVTSGGEVTWGELFVGPLGAFTRAGFSVVAEPSKRRRVVRFEPDGT